MSLDGPGIHGCIQTCNWSITFLTWRKHLNIRYFLLIFLFSRDRIEFKYFEIAVFVSFYFLRDLFVNLNQPWIRNKLKIIITGHSCTGHFQCIMKSKIHSIGKTKFSVKKSGLVPKATQNWRKKNLKFPLHFSTNFWLSYYGTHKDPSIGKLIIKNPFVYDFVYIFYDL